MSDRPTPLTAPSMHAAANESIEAMFRRGCDLERKLAEANEQLDGYKKRLDSSQRARRSLSDAADYLNKRLREEQAKLAVAREALEAAEYELCRFYPQDSPPRASIKRALARIDEKGTP